jgi:hypothetical protein
MTGLAQGRAAEAAPDQSSGSMRSPARVRAGKLPPRRLGAAWSGPAVQPAASGKGRRRRSGRAAVALGRRIRRSAAGARVGRARGVGARRGGPEEEIEWWRIRRATSGSVRVATRWRRPPYVGQRSTSTAKVRWRSPPGRWGCRGTEGAGDGWLRQGSLKRSTG